MLELDGFLRALAGGESEDGVLPLPAETITALRGSTAYALTWFENWTRDGQPSGGRLPLAGPYPPTPHVELTDYALTGYATTGDEPSDPPLRRRTRRSVERIPGDPPAFAGVADAALQPAAEPARVTAPAGSALATEGVSSSVPSVPSAPEPGWYPSPTSGAHQQFWDGRAWTTERRVVERRRGFARFLRRRSA